MTQINDTVVTLEWSEPLDRGGRSDLTYRVLCSFCGAATAAKVQPDRAHASEEDSVCADWSHSLCPLQGLVTSCSPCDDSVLYRPAQRGLTQRRVVILGLRPHTNYTFTVQSLNGVSALSQSEAAADRVNVTTSRDGTQHKRIVLHYPACPAYKQCTTSWLLPLIPDGKNTDLID